MAKINDPGFQLGDQLTEEQLAFFDKNGFIIFRNFLTPQKVELYLSEAVRIEKEWLAENRDKVNGVPLKFGMDDKGERLIQRLCFLSLYSKPLHALLNEPRLQQVVQFLSPYEGRIAEDEKDGLVLNHYVNSPESSFTQMGWHTDSPRDIFLGQKIMPMLNVGIHLNDCPYENGGLRLLPGTHKQGIFGLLFRKKYFIDNNEDPDEVGMDIKAGDLTVHDGRLWHRAQSSPHFGEQSRRRVMYVPVITGKYMPKSEKSKTPLYHRIASWVLD